jgi:hypothetical protein
MQNAFIKTPEQVLAHFKVDKKTGLDKKQVEQNSLEFGKNGKKVHDLGLLNYKQNFPLARLRLYGN